MIFMYLLDLKICGHEILIRKNFIFDIIYYFTRLHAQKGPLIRWGGSRHGMKMGKTNASNFPFLFSPVLGGGVGGRGGCSQLPSFCIVLAIAARIAEGCVLSQKAATFYSQ